MSGGEGDGGERGRRRLVAAAHQVLRDGGIDALGVREVARRAGVSHGAPRRHFPTLAGLCSALAADGFRSLIAAVDDAVTAAGPDATAVDRLRAAGRGYVTHAVADPSVFALMFRAERCDRDDPDLAAAGSASFEQLRQLVVEAQAEGWRHDAEPGAATVSLWAAVHGFVTLAIDGPGFPTPVAFDDLLDLHLRIVADAPPDPRPPTPARPAVVPDGHPTTRRSRP